MEADVLHTEWSACARRREAQRSIGQFGYAAGATCVRTYVGMCVRSRYVCTYICTNFDKQQMRRPSSLATIRLAPTEVRNKGAQTIVEAAENGAKVRGQKLQAANEPELLFVYLYIHTMQSGSR